MIMYYRFALVAALLVSGEIALRAEGFLAPSSGNLYIQCTGGTGAATSQFGTGTSPANFVPLLTSLPSACPTKEVLLGTVAAGQAVAFAIQTQWNGQTYYAFSGGTDPASVVAFSDTDNSLGMGGKIIQQTSPSTWVMHMDDAASYTVDDNDRDLLIQLRLATPAVMQTVLPQFAFGGGWYSALYFSNTGTSPASFTVNFINDSGLPLIVPSVVLGEGLVFAASGFEAPTIRAVKPGGKGD